MGADMNMRDYGLADPGKPLGAPKATSLEEDAPCPNCQCQLMEIEVEMANKNLKSGKGQGKYLGCPACPFASPMVIIASKESA